MTTLTPYWLARHPKKHQKAAAHPEHTGADCHECTTRQNTQREHQASTFNSALVASSASNKLQITGLTYKLLSTGQPSCLACKITPYVSGRRLRSSEFGTLTVPRIKTVVGSRAFRSAAPSVLNLIPVDNRTAPLNHFVLNLRLTIFSLPFVSYD